MPDDWQYLASLIIPVWGHADRLLSLARQLSATTPGQLFEMVVLDLGSNDATNDVLAAFSGDIQKTRFEEPCSFAEAANLGAQKARGKYLVFLSIDCVPTKGWLELLLQVLEAYPQVGAVGPALASSHNDWPMTGLALAKGPQGGLGVLGRYPSGECAYDVFAVKALPWSALALRREAYEQVGGFDEALDGVEDADLCLKLTEAGWAVVCQPASRLGLSTPSSRPLNPQSVEAEKAFMCRWQAKVHPDVELGPSNAVTSTSHCGPVGTGVNVVGFFEAELGLGSWARLVVDALEAAGLRCATFSYWRHYNRASRKFAHRFYGQRDFPFDITVACINGDMLPSFAKELPEAFSKRHVVGMWHWELEAPPSGWDEALGLVDELWAGSSFAKGAFAAWSSKHVERFPLAVTVKDEPPSVSRAGAGLPEGFVFGYMCDAHSVLERKNPLGVVQAFCKAFGPGEGPLLVVKVINAQFNPGYMTALRHAAGARPDILLQEQYLPSHINDCWTGLLDCYVSLHRSEGLGLTIAEAMAWGTPVVATGYSGNLDFMTEENSFLVPWAYVEVPDGARPYLPGARWAQPDLDAAAAAMREIWRHPEAARKRSELAREDLRRMHNPKVVAEATAELVARARGRSCANKGRAWPTPKWEVASRADQEDGRRPPRAPLRLNLGAGDDRRDGFLSVHLRADVADVVADVEHLPFPDGSACELLAFDVLEHLPATKTANVLSEWHRVLVPGGKLTLRVPNLEALARYLLAVPAARVDVIRNIYGGHRFGPEGAWDTHHTGWTPDMLHEELRQAGFLVMSDDGQLNNIVTAICLPMGH